jgi:ankyrin repeat protein
MEAIVKQLPASPDLSHLKKQAKRLMRDAAAADPEALARLSRILPAGRGTDPSSVEVRLNDAQLVIAREYGFRSWLELKRFVESKRADTHTRLKGWIGWCFDGGPAERRLAWRMLDEEPELFARDPWFACLTGESARLQAALEQDPDFAITPGGPIRMLPLVAVTHSKLILDRGEGGFLACARLLIEAGADVNARWIDPRYSDYPLSALYGAAGRTHNIEMTRLLLQSGADPNDNESLYHSVEAADPACTMLLLEGGARVDGTNALGRVLDFDRLDRLELLLAHGGDPNERPWTHHAILRGRSLAHVEALLNAGADPDGENDEGVPLYIHAERFGRADVIGLLREMGVAGRLTAVDSFVAACSRGDLVSARRHMAEQPDILTRLDPRQLKVMPDLAAIGRIDAVATMLAVGWPLEVTTAWDATALNLAIFQGDARMVRLLLDAGANWQTLHGYGDNALGTLSFASQAEDIAPPAPRDYLGCAQSLLDHGVPHAAFDRYTFSKEIADHLKGIS